MIALAGLLFWAAQWLDVNEPPQNGDYIVPLAGDPHRLFKAAELYKKGYAPTVTLSRAKLYPPSRLDKLEIKLGAPSYGPYEFEHKVLESQGVPAASIEEFGNGHISTVEEAEALKRHLQNKKATLLLVTSPYHARRAKMIFQDIMPEANILVSVPPEGSFKKCWWQDQQSAQNIVMELVKTAHYLLGGAFRSKQSGQLP
ncbi:YdcF family protein [Salidesulfovibrio onnuriiensis]|uniref:YdcF family protein n=1 Tax=Salidesulfovibrio onnuriiensis TaxID=2583823 RepID=UPI00202AF551|nr:YdcF family protein [Salidesulfovibrio onnuriiensis]